MVGAVARYYPDFRNQFEEYASHVKKISRLEPRLKRLFPFEPDEKTRDFLKYVVSTAASRKLHVEAGGKFWRAQKGHSGVKSILDGCGEWAYDSIQPHPPGRMTPCPSQVKNGRANPTGIAVWYGATNPETAVAEMRPWKGAIVSVAELQATRNLLLVDCGNAQRIDAPLTEDESRQERFVWNSIGEAFSRPVDQETIDIDYVPTQMLAEAFKTSGYDGIQYKSHLGDGYNVVVFELSAFTIGKREVWEVKDVKYEPLCHGEEMQEP